MELPLDHTFHHIENTVSNLHIDQHGITDIPLVSSKGKSEYQGSNRIYRTTAPCSSRILLNDAKAREREVVKKGIDRLEKQVLQYIGVFISKDLVDITLVKKCQTTDIPALNIAVGKMQKSLKRYVGFEDIDVNNCNKIENLMDKAQIWAMDVVEVYNRAELRYTPLILPKEILRMLEFSAIMLH